MDYADDLARKVLGLVEEALVKRETVLKQNLEWLQRTLAPSGFAHTEGRLAGYRQALDVVRNMQGEDAKAAQAVREVVLDKIEAMIKEHSAVHAHQDVCIGLHATVRKLRTEGGK